MSTPPTKLLHLVFCMASMIFNDGTRSSRHGMNKFATFWNINLFPFFKNPLLETGCWMEIDVPRVPSEFPIDV